MSKRVKACQGVSRRVKAGAIPGAALDLGTFSNFHANNKLETAPPHRVVGERKRESESMKTILRNEGSRASSASE